ncbi:MAG TPA: MFS transporter [Bacteroidales bacterium]|jgi:PAT family beta-lactamase induction signal transducer AmpG|nr:MFS transporter [Bacteroidales bacterium]MDI9553340.1 MFS transporter [Bacteroidota bacterium]HPB12762.1 MFS transporter [Bacteroidales bacterium]HPV16412.1 MFS transporter [Bacteroidales bacterium]
MSQRKQRSPWAWVPTLYFFQGIPYSIVMTTSGLIYKTMGISIASFAFWTSVLYLPWAIKPLWSPYIDVVSTKRNWVVWTQLLLGLAFIAAGAVMPLSFFYPLSLLVFAFIAISSASHDIAADGFYMYALDQHQQSFFVGIRSTFYRFAMLTALGLVPVLAGTIQKNTGLDPVTFSARSVPHEQYVPFDPADIKIEESQEKPAVLIFPSELTVPVYQQGVSALDSAVVYIALSAPPEEGETVVVNLSRETGSKDIDLSRTTTGRFEFDSNNWNKPVAAALKVNHNLTGETTTQFLITAGNIAFSWTASLIILGLVLLAIAIYNKIMMPYPDEKKTDERMGWKVYKDVFVSFFSKPGVVPAMVFFLFYRLGESQLLKVATPFLVDSRSAGGIGLTSAQYGIIYGTVGMLSLTVGGILGGILAARVGLKKVIFIMALWLNLPSVVYIYLAHFQPMPGSLPVYLSVAFEQFGYGYGFTAYMLYMLHYVGESKYKTAEYAIGTSLMALGMMLPGMISGAMKELLGYENFFIYIIICSIPGLLAIKFLKIDPSFGIKKQEG